MGNTTTGVIRLAGLFAVAFSGLVMALGDAAAGPIEDGVKAYEQGDFQKAVKLWSEAAAAGDPEAQNKLGVMYHDGKGVPRSDQKAIELWRNAAEAGHPAAQNNLGIMYDLGQGVPRSDKLALYWFLKSAKQGYAKALYNMGRKYDNGEGVPANEVTALMFYALAARNGNPAFVVTRDKLARFLTAGQRQTARTLAREWIAAHQKK